jgi:DNA mismatch repair protein MutL
MGIQVLDSRVISQIAAGEVVERPASVVKELVENALDAGATIINVEIKGGGTGLIRVIDNGCGIEDDQAELAFERHATSKIAELQDLEKLDSLGFRGEALPSIASVARVEMTTSPSGTMNGSYLELEDGVLVRHERQARSPGTTISVYNLFRKIPARLKFLKSEAAENSRIADVVSRYALAYPEVKFSLTNDSRSSLRTPGSGKLLDAVNAVFGGQTAGQMLTVESGSLTEEAEVKVSGLVSTPQLVRSTRDYLIFFVNRRWVNNRMLGFAVEEAYHGLLMQGKHPLVVLNLTLQPNRIDVNVHPSKTEIKFQSERMVFSVLQKTVRSALVATAPVTRISELRRPSVSPSQPFTLAQPRAHFSTPGQSVTPVQADSLPVQPVTPLLTLPLLRLLGQLACNYILAEGPDSLYLIDQHAAHERVMLEKLQKERSENGIGMQGLLPPETFEVESRLTPVITAHLAEVNRGLLSWKLRR